MGDEKKAGPAVPECGAAPCEHRPSEETIASTAALARSVASIIGFVSRAGDHTAGHTYVVARALELAVGDLGSEAGGVGVAVPGHEACVEEFVQRVRAEIVRQAKADNDQAELLAAAAKATQAPGAA